MFGALKKFLGIGKSKIQAQAEASKKVHVDQHQAKAPDKPVPVVRDSCSCVPHSNLKRVHNRKKEEIRRVSRKINRHK